MNTLVIAQIIKFIEKLFWVLMYNDQLPFFPVGVLLDSE